ncbi:MAG TPA: hypothetical protein VI316_06240 [Candidatus Dormibacteraeota bacterium]
MTVADLKVFRPDDAPGGAARRGGPVVVRTPVRVAEVTAERDMAVELPLPLHLLGPAGTVSVQLRTMLRRVAMGAGLARRTELVEAVRAVPGLPGLVSSPAGGTFVVGGERWLGVAAIGTPPPGDALALDWMVGALRDWFNARLAGIGVAGALGRVEGAWCPGFSDLSAGGRKLAGLGFRVTKDWVVMRGVLAVQALDDADLELLTALHALIGVDVVRAANTSLAEQTGDSSWTAEWAIALLAAEDAPVLRG